MVTWPGGIFYKSWSLESEAGALRFWLAWSAKKIGREITGASSSRPELGAGCVVARKTPQEGPSRTTSRWQSSYATHQASWANICVYKLVLP